MSIQIGDINLVDSAINNEYRIGVMEKILDRLLAKMPPGSLGNIDIEAIRNDVLRQMQIKYPNMGLGKK